MKNREFRVLVASLMLAGMVAGSLSTTPIHAFAKENTAVVSAESTDSVKSADAAEASGTEENTDSDKAQKEAEESREEKAAEASSVKPRKEETVYARVDGSGSVKSITVSDQLKNISEENQVQDISSLKDIVNVKGNEAFSAAGEKLVWDMAGEDICYQGTTTKELPVGIKITYTLDGKQMSAEELKGKSGHLVIRYTYENKTREGDVATPFLMVTGLILNEDTFQNVTVTNGKLMSDGERDVAVGYGLPAVKDVLGVEDLDIPDYFEVEADVTDYEAAEGITVATNSIFNDLATEKFDSLNDLSESMEELQDASNKLVDGSGALKEGIDTLLSSSDTLTDGIGQLTEGGDTLQGGTDSLVTGSSALAAGNAKLADGTGQLLAGSKTLAEGAGQLDAGLKTAADKTKNELLPGAQALKAGIDQMQGSLSEQLPLLCNGIAAMNTAMNVGNAETQTPALNAAAAGLSGGAAQLAESVGGLQESMATTIKSNVDLLAETAGTANTLAREIAGGATGNSLENVTQNAESMAGQAQALTEPLDSAQQNAYLAAQGTGGTDYAVELLWQVQSQLQGVEGIPEGTEGLIADAIAAIQEDSTARSNAAYQAADQAVAASGIAQTLSEGASGVAYEVAAASEGVDAMVQSATLMDNLLQCTGGLQQGLKGLQASMDNQLLPAMQQLTEGANSLKGNTEAFQAGLNQVAGGLQTLDAQVNSQENGLQIQVNDGISQLQNGTARLVDGIGGDQGLVNGLGQLSAGAASINSGSAQLSEKLGEADAGAKSAASGAGELASGAVQLNDGAKTLKDGLHTLQTGSDALIDGVRKLDDGAGELNEGMIQFDRDGIQKLTEAFNGDIDTLITKMNNLLDASRSYQNFSGMSGEMDGEVKFIFITEE